MTIVCSTVILLLLTVQKILSNQWASVCSVNNSDKMGQPGGSSTAEKNSCSWDVPPVV